MNQNFAGPHRVRKVSRAGQPPPRSGSGIHQGRRVGPTERHSHFVLASFYLVNRQLDKAEAAFKALAGLDGNKPESQVVLADFYSTVGRMDEAVKIYQDIVTKSPDFLQGRYRLAELLLVRGDTGAPPRRSTKR